MSRKHGEQGQAAKGSNRDGRQPDGSAPERTVPDSRPAPNRFRPNVFTWTGPGIENIFVDFEPERKTRNFWKGDDPESRREASKVQRTNG